MTSTTPAKNRRPNTPDENCPIERNRDDLEALADTELPAAWIAEILLEIADDDTDGGR